MHNAATVEIARDTRHRLADSALTERQAKLYSQRLRLDMGREGLVSFTPGDVEVYLDEAMLLLQCGFLERNADPTSEWRDSVKRAAEILEWLSQPSLKPLNAPLHLLTAAAYQLAGYPAMALGHLRYVPDNEPFSVLLRELLRANFHATLESVNSFWREQRGLGIADLIEPDDLTALTYQHIVMCIGAICTYLRTGNDGMTERALAKLDKLAESLLHSRDPYSFMLASLTAATCRHFVETCIWPQINRLREVSSAAAGAALIQFARSSFVNGRALIWPAQAAGIERLRENSSFVLCTPTGSGKTTVATLAVVQGLFSDTVTNQFGTTGLGPGNLVLYLVPSRALAAEVEGRLAQDLRGIAAERTVVTGLYGGVDWGPTDAWVQTDRATIVVCTFEKADALMRYLGVLFLDRVRLVVIDEAHMVEQDRTRLSGLEDGSSRAFRLEQLGARLLRARDQNNFRIIALSAVAAHAAPALARWITGGPDAHPTTSSYRSTRQLLGRLEVNSTGEYTIRYDLMDGQSLEFADERPTDTPYVRRPFAPLPGGLSEEGPEVRMRAPTLWAALQLAAERPDGSAPSVLISLTQSVEAFSLTCVHLMDAWPEHTLPNYRAIDEANDLWVRCLAAAADYFTVDSVEYRLLRRGIAVHHGKMPGLLARRLKGVIDQGYVRVIIATSTLSEGVNIPVTFLLLPSVCRGPNTLGLQEFTNLIGRAGRPGVSTEGNALVVLPERTMTRDRYGRARQVPSRQWDGYEWLIAEINDRTTTGPEGAPADEGSSALAHLLRAIETAWSDLTGGGEPEDFNAWLEQTAVVNFDENPSPAHRYLDTLDAFLIAAIQEIEELQHSELAPNECEAELIAIWRRTYAFAASHEEDRLGRIWLTRGCAIKTQYPDQDQRRRIYKTSLSPRSATSLMNLAEVIRAALKDGMGYAFWDPEQRFVFIRDVLGLLSQVPSFRISTTLGRRRNFEDWPTLLRWWLARTSLESQPEPKKITSWYEFVSQNFVYRGAWGLGSIIGLLLEAGEGEQPIRALDIGDWPRSGLPWITFWIKELITWGTLEPVAAFLLARGDAIDRPQAEMDARTYYDSLPDDISANDALDPGTVRDWVDARRVRRDEPIAIRALTIQATLERPADDYLQPKLNTMPVVTDNRLIWIDPAGYVVATSEKPVNWPDNPSTFEFDLDVRNEEIVGNAYLQHR